MSSDDIVEVIRPAAKKKVTTYIDLVTPEPEPCYPELLSTVQGHIYDKQYPFSPAIRRQDTWFRVKVGTAVKYIHVAEGTFGEEWTAVRFKALPNLPWQDDRWNVACFSKNPGKYAWRTLQQHLEWRDLHSVHRSLIWHEISIDVLDVYSARPAEESDDEGSVSHEAINGGKLTNVFAKHMLSSTRRACDAIEAELSVYHHFHVEAVDLSIRFLGNLVENGRTTGFILERPQYRELSGTDAEEIWRSVDLLERFHGLGYVHGQLHDKAFIILGDGSMKMMNFAKARPGTEAERKKEYEKYRGFFCAINHGHVRRR